MPPKQLAILSSLIAAAMIYFAYASSQRDSTLSASFALGNTPAAPSKLPPEIMVLHNDGKGLLLQLDMSYYTRASFDVTFQDLPLEGWCMNLGDAPGNDGWGGDDGRFSNNAEVQIMGEGGAMSIFGNDYMSRQEKSAQGNMLAAEINLVAPRSQLTMEVANGLVTWNNRGTKKAGKQQSEYLFALNGQQDEKHGGPNDKIIFASFNRLIGNPSLTGSCVTGVRVTLYH